MPFDSNGNFTRTQNWTSDFENGIEIVCDRHDDEDDNFANGFNECMLRDGRAPATGNLKMGNFRITGLADGQTSNDAINKGQLDAQNSSLSALITSSISTTLATLYPIGSVYIGTQTACPLTSLISGSKWELVSSEIVTDVNTKVSVYGNGTSIGLTDGTKQSPLTNRNIIDRGYCLSMGTEDAGISTGANTSGGNYQSQKAIGLVSDASKSGIEGTLTRSKFTTNVWKRVA